MPPIVKRIAKHTLSRYILVGGFSYCIEIGVLLILSHILHIPPVVSVAISFWVGLVTSFVLQKLLAFQNKQKTVKSLVWQSAAYGVLIAVNYIFTLGFVALFDSHFGLIISRTIALIITTGWNYLAYSRIIFARHDSPIYKKASHIFTWVIKNLPTILFCISLIGLFVSSCYVGYKSAIAQNNNHDQLIDSYLTESPTVLHNATFPGAHSLLVKLPIFAATALLGNHAADFTAMTILLYLTTVMSLAYIVYRATGRNKLSSALILLMLTSVLALIPVQPIPGAQLPTNMAMVTTRNIEYILFILLILGLIRIRKLVSYTTLLTAAGLIILGSSDKLFAILSIGIAVIIFIARIIISRTIHPFWKSVLPVIVAAVGYIGSTLLLSLINGFGLFHISAAGTSSPFAITLAPANILSGLKWSIKSLLINFGAFPAHATHGVDLMPYILNCLIFLAIIVSAIAAAVMWIRKLHKHENISIWLNTSTWLFSGSLLTIAMFVCTIHSYQADARYIGLSLFAGFIALAYMSRHIHTRHLQRYTLIAYAVCILFTPLIALTAHENLNHTVYATDQVIGDRMNAAASILEQNNASVLVGDFWFTVPTQLKTNNKTTAVPETTDSCDTPNPILDSTTWQQPSPQVHTSALYILRDAGANATTFNHGCTMAYLNKKYGVFEKQYIIRGTTVRPVDIIRIYNYDIRTRIAR